MEMELSGLQGACGCGREHALVTKRVLVGAGVLSELDGILGELSLLKNGCAVCDGNTRDYAVDAVKKVGKRMRRALPMVVLNPQDLHANERAVEEAQNGLPENAGFLIAVGAGTIHDITRYIAKERGIPFISVPTAASVDGFVSTVSAMTWNGLKKTFPGVAPLAVLADSDIFAKAPYRLTASGAGDALGKFTALLDWQCGKLLLNEDFCGRIFAMEQSAAKNVLLNLPAIHAGDLGGCEELMRALLLSGLCMQLWGDSRPASGGEHHLSHLWEMEILNGPLGALHGEKVGVGLLTAMRVYEKLLSIGDIERYIDIPYAGMPLAVMRKRFGPLYDDILKENQPDLLRGVTPQKLAGSFEALREMIAALPPRRKLRPMMHAAGLVTTAEEIGIPREIIPESILLSPFVRRRMTVMRAMQLLKL